MKGSRVIARALGVLTLVALTHLSGWGSPRLAAQQAPSSQATALPHGLSYVEEVLQALDASRTIVYQAIAEAPAGTSHDRLDQALFAHIVRDGVAAGATPSAMSSSSGEGGRSEPVPAEVQALLGKTDAFYWRLLSLAADPDPSRLEREGPALVQAYEAETDEAQNSLAAAPTDMAVVATNTPAGAFQQAYPRLHGLMWAQTWLRLAVFEPLLVYRTPEARQAGLSAVLARFWSMLDEAPINFPTAMPMAPTIAQTLTVLTPAAAAVLENEDMLRESIGDVLVGEPIERRSNALLAAAAGFRDGGYRRYSRLTWKQMAVMHGVVSQGGFAVQILTTPEQEAMGLNGGHSMTNMMPGMN